jgi:hypothetical protein
VSKVPWDFVKPGTPETGVRNLPSPEGAALGAELARFVETAQAKNPDAPALCSGCAFRRGSTANQCAPTLMDAVKCLLEGEPFYCHMGVPDEAEPTRLCGGYLALEPEATQ